jgi:hypothetical protein
MNTVHIPPAQLQHLIEAEQKKYQRAIKINKVFEETKIFS